MTRTTTQDAVPAPAIPASPAESVQLAELEALHRSQAVIEFELDGRIRTANENFCKALGYQLEELRGRHHSLFVSAEDRAGDEYKSFWSDLAQGRFKSGEFRRIAKDGREIWIQATYNPIFDSQGRPVKVVKFASDITQAKLRAADWHGQIEAIGKSMAVIEFELDGTIRFANENFCNALGYTLDEIRGRHHSIFVDAKERSGPDYKRFWVDLGAGKFQGGEFRRVTKSGREIWIQATYNPIFDPSGRLYKVVKFASDITDQVLARQRSQQIVERVRSVSQQLSGSSDNLSAMASQIARDADDSSARVGNVAAASEQVARNSQTVAAAIDELDASIRSISGSTADAAKVASSAVSMSRQTNETISKLGESSREIGDVIKTITQIAQQTNLLALNATIEAARAGESGKGFAVVANEVKILAKDCGHASEDIARRIQLIQTETRSAVDAIAAIGRIIDEINAFQASIAGAVEEQAAVTAEIGRNIGETVKATEEIARNTTSVARAAESTASGVAGARQAVEGLRSMANELERVVA
ncbi:MAG: PAS domain-containing methyl-accepting chemotaxis protein [Planctomycetes bacterium]|nr:PAS domain-containing methyl-accepting chemotaxis protein [Planctomycetota bacterium]